MVVSVFLYEFIFIFLLNTIPIFGPPTWMVLSFISFFYDVPSLPFFIFVALCAATLGRVVLTLSSKHIIRNRLLGERYKKNMEYLKIHLEKKPHLTSFVFFIEAFTPIPSDQFFIAYGLTGMKLRYALVPFFIARIFTYSFWTYTATELSKSAWAQNFNIFSFLSWPVIIAEVFILFLIFLFVKIDWSNFILNRKLKMIKKQKKRSKI